MSQGYSDIAVTEKVSNSLDKLLQRDETGVTCSAGSAQPQDVESWMIGRLWLDTQLKRLNYLSSVGSSVVWSTIVDFSNDLATEDYVEEHFQPLSANLTMLSNLTSEADAVPYFTSSTSMDTFGLNTFLKNVINSPTASATRTALGIKALGTIDKITSSNVGTYIDNNSLPISKFNFTPITSGEGYTTGDVKESYDSSSETGFLTLNINSTIGDDSSGASYRGSTYRDLYYKLWGNPAVSYYTSSGQSTTDKGSSASDCWNAHKRIKLPIGTSYLNANVYYRIKI